MPALRRFLMAAGCLLLVAFLGQLSWGRGAKRGLLRLSWRTNGEQIKVPLKQDPNLPAHMRLPDKEAYESSIRPCRLRVRLDDAPVWDRMVLSSGFRHDRPLSVFVEFSVVPGVHQVEVDFVPEPVEGAPSAPPSRPYRQALEFAAGRVELLSLDSEGRWLLKHSGATGN